jgi:long-chain acyl-CoA synthetase
MELSITDDVLFDQVVIIGESRPFLSALVVLNKKEWDKIAHANNLESELPGSKAIEMVILERISASVKDFPGYAQVYRISCIDEPWTVENDLLTPTLKVKRNKVLELYSEQIEAMYQGHTVN